VPHPYLHSVVEGIEVLLKPDGVVMFEDPYLGDVIQKTAYDQIYDEHTFLFSVQSVNSLFNRYGMEVIDVEPQETHGGSMRYVIARKGARPRRPALAAQVAQERSLGLHDPGDISRIQAQLRALARRSSSISSVGLRKQGKRIMGMPRRPRARRSSTTAASAPDLIESICDTTPIKQGKYSPGMHIPVVTYEAFKATIRTMLPLRLEPLQGR
jgi:methylation protein EvaC